MFVRNPAIDGVQSQILMLLHWDFLYLEQQKEGRCTRQKDRSREKAKEWSGSSYSNLFMCLSRPENPQLHSWIRF
jgi:hypothetical protein